MGTIAKSDVELVEASRRGEHEAFGHLVERYQDVVCAVSYSSTGDRGLSEDVAQDTFITAWRQLHRLRDVVRLGPWLCGIARNLGRKAHKRRRREEILDDQHLSPTGNPFDEAARGDVERVVHDALARVPETYREVLVLYYCENLATRDVAAALGMTEDAVMQRLSRGRRYLADSVSEIVEGSLRSSRRPRRDLVAAVLAAIVVIPIPSRVDASPHKGSTMLKFAAAASAVVVAGTTGYLVYSHQGSSTPAPTKLAAAPAAVVTPAMAPVARFGGGKLGLSHALALGPTTAPRAIVSRSAAEADLGYLPADADTVIGLDFAKVRDSALWKRFVAPELAKANPMREVEALCGFDPLKELGSMSIGLKGLGDKDDAGVSGTIVVHGFDKTKALTCFDKQGLADAEKNGAKITIEKDLVLLTDAEGSFHAAFTFVDDKTGLIVLGPAAATKEGVAAVAAGDGKLATASTFTATLQNVNTDNPMWMMVSAQSKMLDDALSDVPELADVKPGTFYMSLGLTDAIALDAGVGLGDAAAVGRVVAYMKSKLNEGFAKSIVETYFDQLDVFADGADLIVSLGISGEQIAQMLAMARMAGGSDVVGDAQ